MIIHGRVQVGVVDEGQTSLEIRHDMVNTDVQERPGILEVSRPLRRLR